jgi:hypothetical protein
MIASRQVGTVVDEERTDGKMSFDRCVHEWRQPTIGASVDVCASTDEAFDALQVCGSGGRMERNGKRVLQRPSLPLSWQVRSEPIEIRAGLQSDVEQENGDRVLEGCGLVVSTDALLASEGRVKGEQAAIK